MAHEGDAESRIQDNVEVVDDSSWPSSIAALVLLAGPGAQNQAAKAFVRARLETTGYTILDEKLRPEEALGGKQEPIYVFGVASKGDNESGEDKGQEAVSLVLAAIYSHKEGEENVSDFIDQGCNISVRTPSEAEQLIEETQISVNDEDPMTPPPARRVLSFNDGSELALPREAEIADDGSQATFIEEEDEQCLESTAAVRPSLAKSSTQSLHSFKARPVPSSAQTPSITPRLSRAAALRMGIDLPQSSGPTKRVPPTRDSQPSPPSSRPSSTTPIKPSTSSNGKYRTSYKPEEDNILRPTSTRRQSSNTSERSLGYEGTPGYSGRRISVQSTISTPKIVPKETRASMLRHANDPDWESIDKPSSRRQSLSTNEMHGVSRRLSVGIPSSALNSPRIVPKETRASQLRHLKDPDWAVIDTPSTRRQSMTTSEMHSASRRLSLAQSSVAISSASTSSPKYVPRETRASQLRGLNSPNWSSVDAPSRRRQSMTTAEIYKLTKIDRRLSMSVGVNAGNGVAGCSSGGSLLEEDVADPTHSRETSSTSQVSATSTSRTSSSSIDGGQEDVANDFKTHGMMRSMITPRVNRAAELRLAARKVSG